MLSPFLCGGILSEYVLWMLSFIVSTSVCSASSRARAGARARARAWVGFSSEEETLSLPSILVVGWTFLESFFDPSLVRGTMTGIVDVRRLR